MSITTNVFMEKYEKKCNFLIEKVSSFRLCKKLQRITPCPATGFHSAYKRSSDKIHQELKQTFLHVNSIEFKNVLLDNSFYHFPAQ